jgi:methanogenic corrinoid protein MtbC1
MVADLLERNGWRAIQLAANVPAEDLAEAVEFYAADLVALAFSMPSQLFALKDAIAAVRGSHRGSRVKVIVGGCKLPAIAEIVMAFGADGYAENAEKAITLANGLAAEHDAS